MKNLKIAEIVPLNSLYRTKSNQYHMCLAHLVLENEQYAEFYKDRATEGKYVIVDNGAAEGVKLDYDSLLAVYDIIKPTEIILPDVLFDSKETIRRSVEFFNMYEDVLSKYKIMVVPQGENKKQWIKCLNELSSLIPFDTIGIPKWLGKNGSNSRVEISKLLAGADKEIHLLGCNENPSVIYQCREANIKVRGCDSAFAYLCSKAKMESISPITRRPDTVIKFLTDKNYANLGKLMKDFEVCAGIYNNKQDKTWR